ncbi:MAG TPA: NPCBM/NEW2 domain-containing protein [Actinokineospora sp.]|nr:NPCBM/NEW2 domain-containing protein [Actinokineospora sp.]
MSHPDSPAIHRLRHLALPLALVASAISVSVATTGVAAAAAAPGLTAAPPMGWNTWNAFRCDISETKVKAAADAMVTSGMKAAGYQYIVIDDCWSDGRDANGVLRRNTTKFPNDMKLLGDYIHGKGLKFGIYGAPMQRTCAGYAGSLDHEQQDANLFASWGVDYLKYDWCNSGGDLAFQKQKFAIMRDALKATGRPIVYKINPGSMHTAEFASLHDFGDYSHDIRIGEDLFPSWTTSGSEPSHYPMGTLNTVDLAAPLQFRSLPDRWNDWDMLQVGNGGMPENEGRAQFTMWAVGGSPLFAGNDLATMSASTKTILTNADLIAVNQSWGGSAGRRIIRAGNTEVWAKPLAGGDVAVALLNRGDTAATISTSAAALNLGGATSYTLRNLWSGANSTSTGAISATVPARDAVAYRVTRTGTLAAALAAGTHQLGSLSWLSSSNGWGPVEINKSNGGSGQGDGRTMSIGGTTYATGLGAHAESAVNLWLGGTCQTFSAKVGVDDEVGASKGTVQFGVYGDGRLLGYTEAKSTGEAATTLRAVVSGVKALELRATSTVDGKDYDHADWAEAQVTCAGGTGAAAYSSDRTWTASTNGWGPVERDRSNGEQSADDGLGLVVAGVRYPKGIGTHAASDITINQAGCTRFTAIGGVDAETAARGSVQFKVIGDGTTLYTSPTVTSGAPVFIDVDTTGRTALRLVVSGADGGLNYDHADWAGAVHTC